MHSKAVSPALSLYLEKITQVEGIGICTLLIPTFGRQFSKAREMFPTLSPIPRKKGEKKKKELFKLQNEGWV